MAINRILKKQVTNLRPGSIIKGKFKGNRYQIMSKLGEGAIGAVYLCQKNRQVAALKISEQQTSMTLEVNVLKSLGQVRGKRLGPALLDVDDWVAPNGRIYTFYVMEYIRGENMQQYFRKHGKRSLGILLLQLLEDLEALHAAGWVFGDLKADNLIIRTPPHISWVDVGGMTQIGRSIKEYTEFYDRGYWGLGSRRAEPSYDLFSLAMIVLELFYPQRFARPDNGREKFLYRKIDQITSLKPYAPILKKAITGKYSSSRMMKRELQQLFTSTQQKRRTVSRGQLDGQMSGREGLWILLFSSFSLLLSFLIG